MKQADEYQAVHLAGGGLISPNALAVNKAADLTALEALGMLSIPLGLVLGFLPGDWQRLLRSQTFKHEANHEDRPTKV